MNPMYFNEQGCISFLLQGLNETRHPYIFVAAEGFKQMLMIEDAEERTVPLLPKLIPPIRRGLVR